MIEKNYCRTAAATQSVFLSPSLFLTTNGGGVQWCTHDYLETIRHAGFAIEICEYSSDRSIRARMLRKLFPAPFRYEYSPQVANQVIDLCTRTQARVLFLNNISALTVAPLIRKHLPNTQIIFLSHGVESTDHLNSLRLCPELLPPRKRSAKWLGRMLLEEIRQRECLDGVVCISAEDIVFEKWLGADRTCFIPRSITSRPLILKPHENRVGTVATLDHPPNLDGIRRLATSLRHHPDIKLRVVGAPKSIGEQLQDSFSAIEYVGALSNEDLEIEAGTWRGFVNPIFCQARGASTKIATALGWGLPVLTTVVGSRGYLWSDELLPRAESPDELAQLISELVSSTRENWDTNAREIANLAPTLADAGKILRSFLKLK